MTLQTMEQQRSGKAYYWVKAIADQSNGKIKEKYKSRAKNFPSMVRTNGLLQAMSFLMANPNEDGYKQIAEHIRDWIETAIQKGWLPSPGDGNSVKTVPDTIQWLTKLDVDAYLSVTNEVLHFSPWLKRFADGLIADEKGEKKDG